MSGLLGNKENPMHTVVRLSRSQLLSHLAATVTSGTPASGGRPG
jgi:hypothetical protein